MPGLELHGGKTRVSSPATAERAAAEPRTSSVHNILETREISLIKGRFKFFFYKIHT